MQNGYTIYNAVKHIIISLYVFGDIGLVMPEKIDTLDNPVRLFIYNTVLSLFMPF
jgi:hypothetical protein